MTLLPPELLAAVEADRAARESGRPLADARPLAVIFDMDGTLVDVSGIRHFVVRPKGRKDFEAFHGAALVRPSIPWVEAAARACHDLGVLVLIVTARRARNAIYSLLWLAERPGGPLPHEELFMRPDGDFRPDHEVKADLLTDIERDYRVVWAWDDRPSVVEVWRSRGIGVTVVPGFFE